MPDRPARRSVRLATKAPPAYAAVKPAGVAKRRGRKGAAPKSSQDTVSLARASSNPTIAPFTLPAKKNVGVTGASVEDAASTSGMPAEEDQDSPKGTSTNIKKKGKTAAKDKSEADNLVKAWPWAKAKKLLSAVMRPDISPAALSRLAAHMGETSEAVQAQLVALRSPASEDIFAIEGTPCPTTTACMPSAIDKDGDRPMTNTDSQALPRKPTVSPISSPEAADNHGSASIVSPRRGAGSAVPSGPAKPSPAPSSRKRSIGATSVAEDGPASPKRLKTDADTERPVFQTPSGPFGRFHEHRAVSASASGSSPGPATIEQARALFHALANLSHSPPGKQSVVDAEPASSRSEGDGSLPLVSEAPPTAFLPAPVPAAYVPSPATIAAAAVDLVPTAIMPPPPTLAPGSARQVQEPPSSPFDEGESRESQWSEEP